MAVVFIANQHYFNRTKECRISETVFVNVTFYMFNAWVAGVFFRGRLGSDQVPRGDRRGHRGRAQRISGFAGGRGRRAVHLRDVRESRFQVCVCVFSLFLLKHQ